MTNENTKRKIAEIANTLELRGFERLEGFCNEPDTIRFRWPSKSRQTYLGTYLNPFSLLGKDRAPMWSDEIAVEEAEVRVGPVYRHNGTKEDVSCKVTFLGWNSKVYRLDPAMSNYSPEYVDLVRRESPTDYTKTGEITCCGCGHETRIAKLSAKAGAKAIANAVEKAVAACEAFEPRDHSAWEQRREDYRAPTEPKAKPAAA